MIYLIPITGSILSFSILYLILSSYGTAKDRLKDRLYQIAHMERKDFIPNVELTKPLLDRLLKPKIRQIRLQLQRLFSARERKLANNRDQSKLKQKLRMAGIRIGELEYQSLQAIIMLGTGVLFALTSRRFTDSITITALLSVIGIYFAYVILRFHLARRITTRREKMKQQLPEVLDMLSVSVESGLGLEQAINHVIQHYNGPLVDELATTHREMSMGRARRDALLGLGTRSAVEEVGSFARAIIQASEMGISIKNVLRTQSAFIRQNRRNKIEEKAMKVSVKILLPMAMFIFPVIFIVLLGPAAVTIFQQFMR